MTDTISINVKNIIETQRAIRKFSARLSDKVTRLALRAGANFMLKQVRSDTPVKSGRLKRATIVTNNRDHRPNKDGKLGVKLVIKPGKTRADKKGAYYGQFIERGFRPGRPKKGKPQGTRRGDPGPTYVKGKKMIEKNYHRNKRKSAQLIVDAMERAGRQIVNEIKRR